MHSYVASLSREYGLFVVILNLVLGLYKMVSTKLGTNFFNVNGVG